MNTYLLVKGLHILSATVLFGTGVGIAFFKWSTDRSRHVSAIRIVAERTVLADWLFTTPAMLLQPISGWALVYLAGYPLLTGWVFFSLCLYLVAVCCWLPVVWLQLRMRAIARTADDEHTQLPPQYWAHARAWFLLGIPAVTFRNRYNYLEIDATGVVRVQTTENSANPAATRVPDPTAKGMVPTSFKWTPLPAF